MAVANNKPNYSQKINSLCSYFNVSKDAAIYMYHRRRRGFPYKKKDDPKYLEWSIPLQNAFVKADRIETFNWNKISFDSDISVLEENKLFVANQPKDIYVNDICEKNIKDEEIKNPADEGWTLVTKKKAYQHQRQLLKILGLLPRNKK